MRTKAILIGATMLAFGAVAAQAQPDLRRKVPDGVELELSGEGLNLVSKVLREEVLKDMHDVPVGDVNTEAAGISVTASGVRASVDFDSLGLTPEPGNLHLRTGLHGVKVVIDSLRLEKTVLGVTLGTTCTNTQFNIAEDGVVYLDAKFQPRVEDENIALSAKDVSLPISSDNYRVAGPDACSGWWGVRDVTRLVLHQVFKALRPFIEGLVRGQMDKLLPALAEQLNAQTHLSITFDIPQNPIFPERTAQLDAFPSRLELDNDKFRAVVGFRIQRVDRRELVGRETEFFAPKRLGSLGFNPTLLSEALHELYPDGSEWLEINGDVFPDAGEILTTETMSALWPDLATTRTTDTHMKLFVRLAGAPDLWADKDTNAILAHVPKIELRFQAQIESQWRDYFIMTLDLTTGVAPEIKDNLLGIALVDGSKVAVDGKWADGYTPADPTFEKDMASLIFSTLLDMIHAQGALFRIDLPTFQIGGQEVSLANPNVVTPFMRIDVMGE